MLNLAKIRKAWFVERIESLKESGIPYTEIAASLGVKPQYLNLIKNTERGASEKLTQKLCESFNLNYNDLLERVSSYKEQSKEIPEVREAPTEILPQKRIPLHNTAPDGGSKRKKWELGGNSSHNSGVEWIDTGVLFPDATSAIRHYGDSMAEYPSGSILILKRMPETGLIIWGRNYYVETNEVAVTKRLQDGGRNHIIGYSSNPKTYPDGRLIHEPVKILKKNICHIHLILGCVTKEFGDGLVSNATI